MSQNSELLNRTTKANTLIHHTTMLIIIQAQVHDGNPLFSLSPELNYLM